MLGYSDESSAIRAFKRIYGITPGAYKKLKYKQT
jgi:AraC-like DNA-binding protein